MTKYRKRPIVIEAIQFLDTVESISAISEFTEETIGVDYVVDPPRLKVYTSEGTMYADVGDFIIKEVQGGFSPCKPDIFEQLYERVLER